MGEKKFTEEQLSAINTRDKSLLVSAAAGSGKTATLTERIIRSILDENGGEDISRMLIVTFTNAAVDELRERINAAIKKELLKDPENKRLEEQLRVLPLAKISTIDAFCNSILKNNTEKFGISPKYRIADPIEASILSHTVWSALIDSIYNGELSEVATPEQFEELASTLTGVKSDAELEGVLDGLYSKAKSHEDGTAVFRKFATLTEGYAALPPEQNPYTSYAIKRVREVAEHYAQSIMRADTPTEKAYDAAISADIGILTNIKKTDEYEKMQVLLADGLPALPRISGEKSPAGAEFKDTHDAAVKELKKCRERYFRSSKDELSAHFKKLSELLYTLAAVIEKFDGIYFEEKRRLAMLEYSDIERLTYLSLYDSEGNPSELALTLREEFSSVYIDEYQDVNSIQNKIFLAVSRENNRFTVGDIKQSIYGFRSARPDLFADMKKSLPDIKAAADAPAASIFMSKNFRCDVGIISFVNDIFNLFFSLISDSIGYVSEDRLDFAKIYEEGVTHGEVPVEVHTFLKSTARTEDGEEDDEDEAANPEAEWIAEKAEALLMSEKKNDGTPITPKDIAIILRKKSRVADFAEALAKRGIPARTAGDENFFLSSDIQLMLCLLNVINNPLRDVYLAGLMLSPIFSFKPDELLLAKRSCKKRTLWESVCEYIEKTGDEKLASFREKINRYREIAEGMQVDALVMRLYNECGLLALAAKNGSRENLFILYNYAKKFEASAFEGLYGFINYVNTVIESGAEFSAAKDEEAEDAVTILTVHKSKGLEYPVVFVADTATALVSTRERSQRVAYSDRMGIAMRTRIPGGLALVESPVYNAITDMNTDSSVEEELRVYYVALTRARERLFVVGSPRAKTEDDYLMKMAAYSRYPSRHTLREIKSFMDAIHVCGTDARFFRHEKLEESQEQTEGEELEAPALEEPSKAEALESPPAYDKELYNLLSERFAYKYPREHLSTLPEKMSISNLYPTVLDGADEEPRLTIETAVSSEPPKEDRPATLPEFISGKGASESARRGIATHNFMQFFDIEMLEKNGAQKELERLAIGGFISKENKERVRLSEIERFAKSRLYEDMKRAEELYREFRFSVMLPASHFTQDAEKKKALADNSILLQGVIDCILRDADGNLHLVDYKTDRLTKEERENPELAHKKLIAAHSLQLSYYALAIKEIFGKSPKTVRVYSLPLGDTVDIPKDAFIAE